MRNASRTESRQVCLVALVCSLLLLVVGRATRLEAQTTPEAIRLEYSASAPDCPDAGALLTRVLARTAVAQAITTDRARVFRVTLVPRDTTVQATLVVIAVDGTSTSRTLVAPSCDQLVSAVALVAALAIEEYALEQHRSSLAASSSLPREPSAAETGTSELPPALSTEASLAYRFRIGLSFDVGFGQASDPLLGPSLSIALRRELSNVSSGLAGPDFRLALGWASSGSIAMDAQSASFGWWTAALETCPISWSPVSELLLEPCVLLEAGAIAAKGERVDNARSALRPWVAAGVNARASWRFAPDLSLELGAGAEVPWIRDRFYFASGATVLQSAELVWLLEIGASWTIL